MVRSITPRIGWNSLVDDDVAFTVSTDGEEISGSSRDFAFLRGLQLRCQYLAIVNYCFVVVIYFVAYTGYLLLGYGAIVGQVILGMYQQVRIQLLLKMWCEHLPHLSSAFNAKLRASTPGISPPLALLLFRGGLAEWLCPALDSLCLGGSWLAWRSVPEGRFKAWCGMDVPRMASEQGLPMLLTACLSVSTLLQLWQGSIRCGSGSFNEVFWKLRDSPPGSIEAAAERCRLWRELASRSHVNSLVLLADSLQDLGEAELEWLCSQSEWEMADAVTISWITDCCGLDLGVHSRKIFAKLLAGVLPSLWFTITMFAMIFDVADPVMRMTCLLSICASTAASTKILYVALVQSRTQMAMSSVGFAAVYSGGVACFFALCAARFVGVLACPDHHWLMSEFSCGAWNETSIPLPDDAEWQNYVPGAEAQSGGGGHAHHHR